MKRWIVTAALLALPAMPIAYADGLPELGEAAEADLPAQAERAIGERTMVDIRLHEPGYIADPEINGYLTRLANRLAAQLDGPKPSLEAFALRDATLNAFAMPGGFIGVHTGLIATTQSESELAS
ncbi:MAG TPA: M48 family metalloprotease, partial [Rhodocyclaceae bacterium]